MSSDNLRPIQHLAQLSYCSHLLKGKNVLLFGQDFSKVCFLRDSGVGFVIAVGHDEPSPEWRNLTSDSGMEYLKMPFDALDFDNGVFDAVIVPDMSRFKEPTAVLREIHRVLGSTGVAIISAPNAENEPRKRQSIDYYAFYESLVGVFRHVRMIGQSPFAGYAIVDLGCDEEDFEVSLDSELMGGENEGIEWFLAVCGQSSVDLEPYSVVQVPVAKRNAIDVPAVSAVDVSAIEKAKAEIEAQLEQAKLELGNRGVKIESLEKKLEEELKQSEEARARAVKLAKELDDERKATTKKYIEDEFAKRSVDIEAHASLRDLQKELRLAEERANSAEAARDNMIEQMRRDTAELDRLRNRLEQAEAKRKSDAKDMDLAKNLRLAEERARSAEAVRDDLMERSRRDADELERLRAKLEEATAEIGALRASEIELKEKISTLEQRARAVEQSLAEKESSPRADEALDTELASLAEENRAIESELRNMAAKKGDLEAEIHRLEALVRDLVVALDARSREAEQKNEGMELVLTDGPDFGGESTDVVRALEDRISSLETEIAALMGSRSGQHRARVEAELELSSMAVELERAKADLVSQSLSLRSKDEDIRELTDTLSTTRSELDRAREEIERAVNASERLKKELDERRSDLRSEAESGSNDMRVAEMEAELQSCRWRIDELEARNQALLGKCEEMKAKEASAVGEATRKMEVALDAAERRERMLGEEVESRDERAKRLKTDLDASRQRVETLEHEIEESKEARGRLERELGDLSSQLKRAKEDVENSALDSRRAREAADTANARAEALSIELKAAQAKIDQLMRDRAKWDDELERRLRDAAVGERERQKEIVKIKEEAELSERRLQSEVRKCEALQAEITVLNERLKSESNLSHMAGADAARSSGEADALRMQLAKSAELLAEKDAEIDAGFRVLASLREEMAVLTHKREKESRDAELSKESQAEMNALSAKTELLRERLDRSERDLEEAKKEVEEFRKRLDDGEHELLEAQDMIADMEAKVVAINQSKVGMSVELADAIQKAEQMEADLKRAKSKEERLILELENMKSSLHDAEANASRASDEIAEDIKGQAKRIDELKQMLQEKESLLSSLTDQLEERERRASKLEQTNQELEASVREHEADVTAWNMELKLRNARISQLEKELAESRQK